MHISLLSIAVVCGIKGNRIRLNVVMPRLIGQILRKIENTLALWSFTWTVTKVGILVHIEPHSCKLDLLIENIQHILPVLSCIWIKEVDKCSCSWPNFAVKLIIICVFNEYVPSFSLGIGGSVVHFYSCINNWNIVIWISYEFHIFQWKSLLVDGKIFIVKHVINICPYRV